MTFEDTQSNRPITAIRDVDEAARAFSNAGIDVRIERMRDQLDFSFHFQLFPLGAAELICTNWSTDNWSRAEFTDRMAVMIDPKGTAPSVFTTSGHSVPASVGLAPILQPGRHIKVFRPAQTPLWVLSANMKDLERLLREFSGNETACLDFAPSLDRESPEGRRFARLVNFAVEELRLDPSASQNPIIRRQLDDLILGGILALPGNHHHQIVCSSGCVASTVVRRAKEFMEANVGRPIGMSDVARECGCSRSKLYQAFKKHRQGTPWQFLIRQRLELARRRLRSPSERMTVTMVSLDCGYANVGRFAQEYRKLYGETPSMTLNRHR